MIGIYLVKSFILLSNIDSVNTSCLFTTAMNQARDSTPTILYISLLSLLFSHTHIPTRSLQSNHRSTQNKIKNQASSLSLPSLALRIDQSPPIHAISKQTFFMLVPNFKNQIKSWRTTKTSSSSSRSSSSSSSATASSAQPMPSMVSTIPCQRLGTKRERVKKGTDNRQTDNRRREKRGKDRETRSEIWREKGRKHVILFFFPELRLSTMKRAK